MGTDDLRVRLKWEPRDVWIGVFVDRSWWEMGRKWHRLYICILPMLPLIVTWREAHRGD